MLVYPATDLTGSHPSMQENGEGYLLTADAMAWFSGHYLAGADPRRSRVSPLFADQATLKAAPPALVITAEFDPLRDEGEAYVERLRAAGVPVQHTRYDGMIHGFCAMRGLVPAADRLLDQIAAALRQTWG